MHPHIYYAIAFLILLSSCGKSTKHQEEAISSSPSDSTTIAFGSCSQQNSPQQMWEDIVHQHPDFWLWGGDNIYADTEDMALMQSMYDLQKNRDSYQELLKNVTVMGVWDDHDYGLNDGGRYFPQKDSSKILLLHFLDVPSDQPVWKHPGAYQNYVKEINGLRIQFIFLDTRYFRDSLYTDPTGEKRYIANPDGDMLGEAQWKWLEAALSNHDVDANLLMSSIQVIPKDHGYEKWANLPKARQKLFDIIQKTKPNTLIMMSGDRHMAEISKIDLPELGYPLYEFTSSGLTHTWSEKREEKNDYRVGKMTIAKNFGLIHLKKKENQFSVQFEVKGYNDTTYQQLNFQLPAKADTTAI